MTYKVGLTGGIGSGKSTAAQFFAALGAPIIDADKIAHEIIQPDHGAYRRIVSHFGEKILLPTGEINRRQLRDIIFEDAGQRHWLEHVLHPLIHQTIVEQIKQVTYPYCIVMIPLLAEHFEQYQELLDYVIVIQASPEQQIAWGANREQSSPEHIKKIMQTQATADERAKIANTILDNEGSLQVLQQKVQELHQAFSKHG